VEEVHARKWKLYAPTQDTALGSKSMELYMKTDYKFGTKESSDLQSNDYKHDDSKTFCGDNSIYYQF
jgi:hypothetical protein